MERDVKTECVESCCPEIGVVYPGENSQNMMYLGENPPECERIM